MGFFLEPYLFLGGDKEMKYGQGKYGESKYGRYVNTGNGNISLSSALSLLKVIFSSVGNGTVLTNSTILRQCQKYVGGTINPGGTISKICSFIRNVGNAILIPYGTINLSISKTISATVNMSSSLSRTLSKLLSSLLNITGLFEKSAIFIRLVGNGNINLISMLRKFLPFFFINAQNKLMPLGLNVKRDTRIDLFPSVKEQKDSIPGRNGEINFDSKLKARQLEFYVATNKNVDYTVRESIKRKLASFLNPKLGVKSLVFEDDPDKVYYVKYSGNIDVSQYANWFEFVIPFKMSDPNIYCSWEAEGTGNSAIQNIGNIEAPLIVEIEGPITNPTVNIDGTLYAYNGAIASGSMLVINSNDMSVYLNNDNVLDNWSGGFPFLSPGNHTIIASDNVTVKLQARWL